MIKKQATIIILIAFAVSAGIWIHAFAKKTNTGLKASAEVFKGLNGWGYSILVNDSLFIHQETIPGLAGKKGFSTKEQADKVARLLINKMKAGRTPALTTFEREQICRLNETQNDRP